MAHRTPGFDSPELKYNRVRSVLPPLLQLIWPFLETKVAYVKCFSCGFHVRTVWKEWGGGIWLLESEHVFDAE